VTLAETAAAEYAPDTDRGRAARAHYANGINEGLRLAAAIAHSHSREAVRAIEKEIQ
jgi:hypothetical protein